MAKSRKPAITGVARPEGFIDDVVIAGAKAAAKRVAQTKPVNFARKKMGKSYYADFGEFGKAHVTYPKTLPKIKKK